MENSKIEERAEQFCQDNGLPAGACASQVSYGHNCMYKGYITGATEQRVIDIDKFKEFLIKIGRGEKCAALERFMEERYLR